MSDTPAVVTPWVVSGVMRTGTHAVAYSLAQWLGKDGHVVASEPLNQAYWQANGAPEWWLGEVDKVQRWFHRYPGRHDPLGPAGAKALREVLKKVPEAFPGTRIFKIMQAMYWGLFRQVWPKCPLVYTVRRPLSWLGALVRSPQHLAMVNGWPGPWNDLARQWSERGTPHWPLYNALAFHRLRTNYDLQALRMEAPDALVVDYERLVGSYDLEATRLANYVGLGEVPLDLAQQTIRQTARVWPENCPWRVKDLLQVVDIVEARGGDQTWTRIRL